MHASTTPPVAWVKPIRREPTAPPGGQDSAQHHKPCSSPQSQNDEYSQYVQELESPYDRAVRELRAEINNRGHDNLLGLYAQDVLNAVEEAKNIACGYSAISSSVRDRKLANLTDIITTTKAGLIDPQGTLSEYKDLTERVVARKKDSTFKTVGSGMLSFLGALGVATGVALSATGVCLPLGIPLIIAGIGMAAGGFALWKRKNEPATQVGRTTLAFHDQMRKSDACGPSFLRDFCF
jgi:hypothetical protein